MPGAVFRQAIQRALHDLVGDVVQRYAAGAQGAFQAGGILALGAGCPAGSPVRPGRRAASRARVRFSARRRSNARCPLPGGQWPTGLHSCHLHARQSIRTFSPPGSPLPAASAQSIARSRMPVAIRAVAGSYCMLGGLRPRSWANCQSQQPVAIESTSVRSRRRGCCAERRR